MFTRRELETTTNYISKAKKDVLNRRGGSDLDYLRDLQTLIKLENAANKALDSDGKNRRRSAKSLYVLR